MRKLLNRMLRMVPLLALVLSFAHTNAQRPYGPLAETDFQFTMQNIVQPAGTNNILEFDIYILDTDPAQDLPMATAQFGINFNLGILNGGAVTAGMTIALPYAEGFSDLPSSMAPNGASTVASGLIRIAGRAAPGCLSGFTISKVAPGIRTNRFRFTSPVPFAPNSTPNFVFTSSTAINPSYATRFAWYNTACTNVQLPVVPGVNALVLENPVLNPTPTCADPTLFTVTGGGSYCQGGEGVPVGLSGSQVGVNYTLNPGGAIVVGNGAEITFGNQLAGTYTVTALSDGTNPLICTNPVLMTGGADVVENASSIVDFTAAACDTYTWALNGETYTASGNYNYVVGCVTNILHLTITPSSTVNFTASACDTYTWALNGETYTASGDYNYVVGCVTNILHLTITPSSTVNFTASACDTYTWALNGETYTASGDYNYVVGCVTNILHLTITPSSTVNFTASACDAYLWALNGETYTASGDYTYVVGCVTNILHLTITPSSIVEFTASACDSYLWALNGETYTASGDYTYVVGCVTNILHLTITPSSIVEFTASACDSYLWALNGETYTASGDYNYVVGCVTNILHLTITPASINEYTAAACDSYLWALNGETYTVSGDYTYVVGCVTNILHLTITPSGNNEYTVSACDSYLWAVSGETYTASGDYTFVNGCSTNILHLTITQSSTVENTAAACDSYLWALNGETYTTSGDYTYTVACVTNILHLTITPSSTVEVTESACDSFTWALNGETYTASGDYTYVVGCVTNILHLTIIESTIVEFTEAACDLYTWYGVNGWTYTESGDYTYVVGCVTNILHLTITPSSTQEFTEVANVSYTWAINGETYTASGDYTYVDGCVTYILHLTIIPVVPCPDFSTWNGSVSNDWFNAANWTPEALPCATTNVTIPAGTINYPTIAQPPTTTVACYVTIAALTIHDGGSLIGQQYLCVLSDVVVERTIVNSNFHLISSPVDAVTFGDVFLPAYWNEVWAREYNEPTGDWMNRFIADNLNVGQGYSVQMTTAPQTATFTGMLNGYDVTRTLSNMNPGTDLNYVGWNLLGNPFPSAIDWDAFSTGAYDGQVAVWDQAGAGNYIYWNGTVGSLTDGIIPTQNGFFVKAATDGVTLTIPMAAQVHNPMPLYKNAVANALELRANGNNYYDATFVHFNSNATADFDSQYDAFKLEGLETAPQLYNMAAGYKLSINELPFEGNEVVNLGFKCGVAGTYSLNASGMDNFSSSTPILLEDLKLNVIQDLRLNPVYSFNYAINDSEARFKLHFKAATGIADPANSGIFVYSYEHTVVINNTTNLNGEIRIFDMTGRELKDANMGSTSETRLPLQVAVGTYIVKVTTAQGTVNQKVYVK